MTDSPAPGSDAVSDPDRQDLVDGMETGSDAGTPGERPEALEGEVIDEEDIELAEAAADERPLPGTGGPQDDGLAPQFQEPEQPDQP